jgi:hypothetical protein
MRVWQVLQSFEGLSDTMASLYDCLRLSFGLDAEAAELFARLRDETLGHRDIVRRERQRMFQSLANYADLKDLDHGALDGTLRAVEDLIARAGRIGLEDALRASLVLEGEAAERHALGTGGGVEPSLAALARTLRAADQDHHARIASFARSRGIAPGG